MFALNSQLEEHLRLHDLDLMSDGDDEHGSLPTENEKSASLPSVQDSNVNESKDEKEQSARVDQTENDANDICDDVVVVHNDQCHECRVQLSAILGSIHAPPLNSLNTTIIPCCDGGRSSTTCTQDNNSNNNIKKQDFTGAVDIIINFADTHANLLVLLQKALEQITIGTSLKLGLGPTSGCVERVEIAALGRRRGLHTHRTAVSLHNARTVVWDAMIQLWTVLNNIQKHVFIKYCDSHDSIELDGEEDYSQQQVQRPSILTISWLKHFRKSLGRKLSKTLSCLSTTRVLQKLNDSKSSSTSKRNHHDGLHTMLDESIWIVKEAYQHITSTFAFDDGKNSSNNNVNDKESSGIGSSTRTSTSSSTSSSFRKHRNRLCNQLDASYVALWAYEQQRLKSTTCTDQSFNVTSSGSENHTNKNNKDDNAEASSELKEWLSHVETLLSKAVEIHREMKEDMLGKEIGSETDDLQNKAHTGDSRNYEHDGPLLGTNNMAETQKDEKWKTKTAVFTGKGALEHRRQVNTKTSASSLDFDDALVEPSLNNIQDHANLVNELRGRLDMIDVDVEEVEVASDDDGNYDDDDQKAQEGGHVKNERAKVPLSPPAEEVPEKKKKSDRPSTAGLFLGATGGLLAELKDFQSSESAR